ncbi:MAG: hypothetical protein ACI4EG_14220 [Fusicatenibacter sp.]
MNEYIADLKRYVTENPPNYGSDAHSILEMLFTYYHECNNTDTDAVKAAFEDLYQRMRGIPIREMDRIVDAVCTLCREHEKAGFVEGVKAGVLLSQDCE